MSASTGLRSPLNCNHSLQGRDEELSILQKAWTACRQEGAGVQIITVHGVSGSGKTSLCKYGFAERKDGYMISGKFDQYSSDEPYSGITKAFSALVNDLLNQSQQDLLDRCLKDECSILVNIVPELAQAADASDEESSHDDFMSESMSFASERIAVALEAFLKEFCSPRRPLVVFFDDIQWSDSKSLAIIASLAENPEIHNIVLLLGYRDETEGADELQSLIEGLPETTDIHLDNINLTGVNALIADSLSEEEHETQALAEVVFRRTHGNPFFLWRFLEMLERKELLKYTCTGWKWDMAEVIAETDASDNVADVLTRQVRSLPWMVQRMLILASCLGFFFNVEILSSLLEDGLDLLLVDEAPQGRLNTKKLSLADSLDRATSEGLVENVNQLYKFSHDRIRQCAYELLPPGESRRAFHYRIGQLIYEKFVLNRDDQLLFLTVNQLNHGITLVKNEEESVLLIELNLQAANAAKEKSAIELANQYTRAALQLVGPKHWEVAYDTVIELETFCAETEWSLGRSRDSEIHVDAVLKHSKSLEDTMRARLVKLKLLANTQLPRALAEARSMLKQLGHGIPPSFTPFLVHEILKTKRMLTKKSMEELSSFPPIHDQRALWSLRIFQLLFFYGWSEDPIVSMISVVRSVQLSMKHGYSEITPSAFAGWGYMLASSGDLAEAYRFGEFAISQIKSKNEMASTYAMACFSTLLKKPSVTNLDLLLQGYRAGLETGDVYRGSICIAIYAELYISLTGLPLKPFAADMFRFGRHVLACRQFEMTQFVSSSLQLALILTGQTTSLDISLDKTGDLLGGVVNQTVTHNARVAALYKELFVRYVLIAPLQQVFDELHGMDKKRYDGAHFFNFFMAFLDGLAAFRLFRSLRRTRYRRIASKAKKELQKHVKNGSIDCASMLALLQAEEMSLSSTTVKLIKPHFDAVISQFSKTGMTHFGAIANERAADQMERFGDADYAKDYIQKATELYGIFGATEKVEEMTRRHSSVQVVSPTQGIASNRGKQRFESARDSYGVQQSARARAILE